ncbi:hypothetical protein ZOSMA_165G00020 [Zostera marina]|uniref:Uncharacterized protein n=1 Tax=Zostera marina TaxID=29655 RepID=A0A0K9PTT8_ZOSMR|nr:hypothetical protein ZOSMA_165G00020 [Zostera marina]
MEKVNDDIADCAIVNYIEKTPSASHKEPVFFRTLRSGRVFYSEDDSIKNLHQDQKFRKRKVAVKKKTDFATMKITSIEINAESESSNANAMATKSITVSETEIAPDEEMDVSEHDIEPDEELEVSETANENDDIPDDMPVTSKPISYDADKNVAEGYNCNLVQPTLPEYLRIRPFCNCVPKSTDSQFDEFEQYSGGDWEDLECLSRNKGKENEIRDILNISSSSDLLVSKSKPYTGSLGASTLHEPKIDCEE